MDRRVGKTTKALINAVRELLVTHAWDAITVRLICDTADISRSTFYAHFDHKEELLDLVFEALSDRLKGCPPNRGLDRFQRFGFLPALIAHMQGHLPLFERNGVSASGSALSQQFRKVTDGLVRDEISQSRLANKIADERVVFLVGGIFAVLEAWCNDKCEISAENTLTSLDQLIAVMLSS